MRYAVVSVFAEQREKFAVVDRRKSQILNVYAGADAKAAAQHRADALNRSEMNGESGNVFFTLFGAVALVGALGVMTTTLMRGPLATVVAVNMAAKTDSAMELAGRLAGQAFMTAGVDCDGDGFKEPAAPDLGPSHAAAVSQGGGGMPGDFGGAKADPWGTAFMFCAWDHGTGTGGCPAGMRPGAASPSGQIAFAIVSAGPDRTFQTTCGADPAYVVKGGDDRAYMFDQAAADALGAGGLWSLKSGDDTTATIDKDLEITTGATFGGNVVFSSSASLTLGGSFLLPTDAEIIGCTGPDRGALRFHEATTSIQVCDGAGDWLPVGTRSLLALDDVPDSYGAASSFLRVNGAGDGVEFGAAAFLDLADVPGSYTAMQGRFLRVDGAGVAFQSAYFSDLADIPPFSSANAGEALRVDGAGALAFSSMGFLDLADTPNGYAPPGYAVTVNAGGDGLQFVSSSLFVGPQGVAGPQGPAGAQGPAGPQGPAGNNAPNNFLGLADTPSSYAGQGGKAVKVNAGATGLEFVTVDSGPECGASWTAGSGTSGNLQGVTYGGGRFVAVNSGGAAFYSADGTTWTAGSGTSGALTSPVYGGGVFVVFRTGGGFYSTDGVTWAATTGVSALNAAAAHGGGRFVAVSGTGQVFYSADGATWTAGSGTSGNLKAVTYGGGRFVAVNAAGGAFYSADGASWTAGSGTSGTLQAVTYGGGRFVAVNAAGGAFYSADGATWTAGSGTSGNLKAVTYGGGRFVAVNAAGGAFHSADGATWTAGSGTSGTLQAVTYAVTKFVAVNSGGGAFYSADGATWTAGSGGGGTPSAVAFGGGQIVMVGTVGQPYSAPCEQGPVENFTDLGDTPASYAGHGGKTVKVKSDESGVEFVAGSGALDCTTAQGTGSGDAVADCPAGYVLTGGGCGAASGNTVQISSPKSASSTGLFWVDNAASNQWVCRINSSASIYAFARCCRIQ